MFKLAVYMDGDRSEELGKKRKWAVSSNIPPRHRLHGPPRTLNAITPCAACKLLRRRCGQQCPFAPYFSPHEPHKFASVHKVFGASNVSKMLKVTVTIRIYWYKIESLKAVIEYFFFTGSSEKWKR